MQGKYAEAEPLYARCQAIEEKALGPEHPSLATTLNNRAGLLSICSSAFLALTTFLMQFYATFQGKYEEAGPLCERSLAIREKALGPDHPDVANSLNTLAELLRKQGKYAEAEPLYARCQAIREKALGPEHPSLAATFNNRALL
ncbi:unnamed protein product, partial [Laminaria digitata]